MADIVSPEVRSRMMSGIRGTNTKPEIAVRKGLHALGFRYRLHDRRLPGTPDIVLPRYRAVIFIHGCFWHGHDCKLFRWPSTRPEFWRDKIGRNVETDQRANRLLAEQGWRQAQIWECAIKGADRLPLEAVLARCAEWIASGGASLEIRGEK